MSNLNFILAYVDDAAKSAELYGRLLDLKPVEASPNWAMFALPSGIMLGLWARHEVEPKAGSAAGGMELCFALGGDDALLAARQTAPGLGLKVIQEPTRMDFGLTFTTEDFDGNRLRFFAPAR